MRICHCNSMGLTTLHQASFILTASLCALSFSQSPWPLSHLSPFFQHRHFFINITSPCGETEKPLLYRLTSFSDSTYSSGSSPVFFHFFPFQQRLKKSLVKENKRETASDTNRISGTRSNCLVPIMQMCLSPFVHLSVLFSI